MVHDLIFLGTGVFVGIGLAFLWISFHLIGSLRIDTSIVEDDPYMFLELHHDFRRLSHGQYVVFRVKCENFDSH